MHPPEAEPPTRPSDDLLRNRRPGRNARRAAHLRADSALRATASTAQTIAAAHRQQPPAEFVPPPPEPEPYRSSSGEPAYEEPYSTSSMAKTISPAIACHAPIGRLRDLWDQYCPPPLNLHIPRGTWANLDYLMWWSRGASLPPLVTTGSQGGALNDPNLKILYGNDRVENRFARAAG